MTTFTSTKASLEKIIKSSKISKEQERFLLDELPIMNGAERAELLEVLKNVCAANKEEQQVVDKVKNYWK